MMLNQVKEIGDAHNGYCDLSVKRWEAILKTWAALSNGSTGKVQTFSMIDAWTTLTVSAVHEGNNFL
jgi:hypothetical protein